MSAVAIVEQLHVIEDLGPRLLARGEAAMVDELVLQVAEEAFHHGVVVGVALAAHAGDEALLSKLILIERADILRALVAVMQQSGRGSALLDRHAQGGQAQRLGALAAHGPADDTARVEVQQHRQMEPSRAGRNDRHVAGPDAIGAADTEAPIESVWRRWGQLVMLHHDAEPPLAPRLDTMLAAQPGDAMAPTGHTIRAQHLPGLVGAVRLPRLHMQGS